MAQARDNGTRGFLQRLPRGPGDMLTTWVRRTFCRTFQSTLSFGVTLAQKTLAMRPP
jgi:hypothetical protein